MSYLIAHIVDHGADVKEFHLRREDGAALPPWQPGDHVRLRFAGFENAYSLIGPAGAADTYRIAVQREQHGKGGSRHLHDALAVGARLALDGPFNSFPLTPPTARVVLIAGGIGITPMLSMAHALGTQGQPVALHYLAQSRDRLVLLDEVSVILERVPGATVVPHLSRESGRADLAALLGPYTPGAACYACGPVSMLQALANAGAALDWPEHAIHIESFGARAQQADQALTVELSLSQITLDVQPGTSILDALIAADVFVSYECKRGECGNCYASVLSGQALHRDVCLTPAMRDQGMCTCVSWAAPGRLVLEL